MLHIGHLIILNAENNETTNIFRRCISLHKLGQWFRRITKSVFMNILANVIEKFKMNCDKRILLKEQENAKQVSEIWQNLIRVMVSKVKKKKNVIFYSPVTVGNSK